VLNGWVSEEGISILVYKLSVLSQIDREPIHTTFLLKPISAQMDMPLSRVVFYTLASVICGGDKITLRNGDDS
jgi:hypothetical protein